VISAIAAALSLDRNVGVPAGYSSGIVRHQFRRAMFVIANPGLNMGRVKFA
jgi:hypothetical protein